jgi:UDP-glucuronate decarboxylase
MRVLITGVAGFIGSNLAGSLFERNHNTVIGIDDFSSSSICSSHFQELYDDARFMFYQQDISKKKFLKRLKNLQPPVYDRKKKIDVIFNLACPASPPRYQDLPVHTLDACYNGTKNVLELAKLFSCRVVHASTSEIYGDPDCSPQPETYRGNVNSYGPRSCYDEGKRVAEALCFEYKKQGVDVRVARIFNTYGPNMDPHDGRVVSNFICQALRNEPMTIYGDGKQTRSFCYVSDLVSGLCSLASVASVDSPVNLGNPVEFTMLELAEKVGRKVYGSKFSNDKIQFKDLPVDDPTQRKAIYKSSRGTCRSTSKWI